MDALASGPYLRAEARVSCGSIGPAEVVPSRRAFMELVLLPIAKCFFEL